MRWRRQPAGPSSAGFAAPIERGSVVPPRPMELDHLSLRPRPGVRVGEVAAIPRPRVRLLDRALVDVIDRAPVQGVRAHVVERSEPDGGLAAADRIPEVPGEVVLAGAPDR